MLKKIHAILAALLLAVTTLIPTNAFAEDKYDDQIQVSPTTNRVSLVPGSSEEYQLYVKSPASASTATQFKVYAKPYSVVNENYELSFNNETNYTQISRWIQFKTDSGEWTTEASYAANPGEKKYVTYRVVVPEDIPAGGQYATVFVEMVSPDTELNSSGVKTISRAGIVVYGTADGETRQEADVAEYQFDTFKFSGNLTADALVKNNGNTDFTVSYKYTVKNLFGKELYSDSGEKVILPETSWRTDTEWAETPLMGIFQVSYKISAADTTRDETKIVMVLPIWVMIIMLLLLTIIIVWIIIFIRKRKERQSRLMVG